MWLQADEELQAKRAAVLQAMQEATDMPVPEALQQLVPTGGIQTCWMEGMETSGWRGDRQPCGSTSPGIKNPDSRIDPQGVLDLLVSGDDRMAPHCMESSDECPLENA